MVHSCHMTVGYVVLVSCLDRADSPPIGLPDHHKQAKRNQQLTFLCEHFSMSHTWRIKFFLDHLTTKCASESENWNVFNQECKNMIVLSKDSELLPHLVDRLADFSRRVVLKHHCHVVLQTCQEQYLQRLQTRPNAAAQRSWFGKRIRCPRPNFGNYCKIFIFFF